MWQAAKNKANVAARLTFGMKPERNPINHFTSRPGTARDYNRNMQFKRVKPAIFPCGAVLFYLAMAKMFLLALPGPREPLHYMVAGAFATAVSLLVAFALYTLGRFSPDLNVRIVRRSGQSS